MNLKDYNRRGNYEYPKEEENNRKGGRGVREKGKNQPQEKGVRWAGTRGEERAIKEYSGEEKSSRRAQYTRKKKRGTTQKGERPSMEREKRLSQGSGR